MGEAEAIYKLIPSMTLTKSNVICQWVALGKKEERSKRFVKATERELEQGYGAMKIKDMDGLWYEQQDMLSKYLRRPADLERMCLAQFAKMYTSCSKKNSKDDELSEEEEEVKNDQECSNGTAKSDSTEDQTNDDEKFHYIMTDDDNGKCGAPLPMLIELSNPFPREPKMMRKRLYPAVLRFNKPKRDNNPYEYMLNELMLYRPFREEYAMDEVEKLYNEKRGDQRKVDIVKNQVMEYLEGVQEARYYVDEALKNDDKSIVANQLDPTLEQNNADCEEELMAEHPDYQHIDPDQFTVNEKLINTGIYRPIKILGPEELRESTRSLDKFQKEVINIGVKFATDLVKSRRQGNRQPSQQLVMVHGGAGAGKSTVIQILAQWMQKIVQNEGDDIGCPHIVKTSFTGTAASNIEGQTLHTSFGFSFDNKHYSLSDKIRDQKKALLKNLKAIIIDEISMVKSDMLYQLDLRLQEITGNLKVPFGGISIFAFGDMMQLKPCLGRYIFEVPSNPEFGITHSIDPRWEMFKSIDLEINHRQGDDKAYADLLNRIRIDKHSIEDIELLETRIRPEGHPDLSNASLHIVCKRHQCEKRNMKYIDSLEGQLYKIRAVNHHSTQKNYKPLIDKKDGSIAATGFLNELKLKIGAKVMLIHNIDIADCLTNGQMGELVAITKSTTGTIDKLVIKLKNEDAGKLNRSKHSVLAAKYKGCVIIERISLQYNIRKKSGDVGSTATLIQFPVKLAHAVTCHKIQGQTIPWPLVVVLDFDSIFEAAQAHVMLSRVQRLDQIYILKDLDSTKIKTNYKALNELKRLRYISMNENPEPWDIENEGNVKIASLNCAGLEAHFTDIETDEKLLKADILHLLETSLSTDEEASWYMLDGYQSHFISRGNGKGLVTYYKSSKFQHVQDYSTDKMQMSKFTSAEVDVIGTYRSQNGNSVELLNNIKLMITPGKTTIVTGDFNICYLSNGNNRFSKGLQEQGFEQLITDATHIRGGHIDHMYYRDSQRLFKPPNVQRYTPYYSDHDALFVTLMRQNVESQ